MLTSWQKKEKKSLYKWDRGDVNHKNTTKKVNFQQAQSYCLTENITKSLMAEGQRPMRSMIKESTENIKDSILQC